MTHFFPGTKKQPGLEIGIETENAIRRFTAENLPFNWHFSLSIVYLHFFITVNGRSMLFSFVQCKITLFSLMIVLLRWSHNPLNVLQHRAKTFRKLAYHLNEMELFFFFYSNCFHLNGLMFLNINSFVFLLLQNLRNQIMTTNVWVEQVSKREIKRNKK